MRTLVQSMYISDMNLFREAKIMMDRVYDRFFNQSPDDTFVTSRILSMDEEAVFAWLGTNYHRGFFNGSMWKTHILTMPQNMHPVLCFVLPIS